MAPKKPSPLEVPPAASSSEELVSGEEEEVESEAEEDTNTEQNQKLPTNIAASEEEEDGSESDSDSDSDHPPRVVAGHPNVKPIAAFQPVDDPSKVKKPRSKPTASPSVLAAATPTRSASKRLVDNNASDDGKDSKRAKKTVPGAADGGESVETTEKENKPKKLFQRVWSEEDEIIILKGMNDFSSSSSKKGTDPLTDLDAFSEFIKKSLHIDFTKTQLNDKMRKLKKKYLNNVDKKKKKKNGADKTFSKRHYQDIFDLSKKMWGTEANNAPPKKKDIEKQQNSQGVSVLEESVLLNQTTISITACGLDAMLIKKGLSLIDSNKKSELEEEWRELQIAEADIFLRRLEFARKQTNMVLDALKKH